MAQAKIKLESGDWKEENGLIVNKDGVVQRSYYKELAKSSSNEDDDTYSNWMKAYNIDGASNRLKASKQASAVLNKLEEAGDKVDKASTAINLMKNSDKYKDMPDWVKDRYYKDSGYSKEQVEYGAKSSYKVNEKMDGYWRPLAQTGDREKLLNELYEGRKKSIDGKNYWATTGIIENLYKEGYLSKSERKYLKSVNLDSNGGVVQSGSGSSGSSKSTGSTKASATMVTQAYKATMDTSVPETGSPEGTGLSNIQTKKQMKRTSLKKYSTTAKSSKSSKITVKNVKRT